MPRGHHHPSICTIIRPSAPSWAPSSVHLGKIQACKGERAQACKGERRTLAAWQAGKQPVGEEACAAQAQIARVMIFDFELLCPLSYYEARI